MACEHWLDTSRSSWLPSSNTRSTGAAAGAQYRAAATSWRTALRADTGRCLRTAAHCATTPAAAEGALRLVICHTTCSAASADRHRHASRSSGAMLCSCRRCQNGLNGRKLVLMSTQPATSCGATRAHSVATIAPNDMASRW